MKVLGETPINTFNKAIKRLKDIFVWNRALSNLGENNKITNANKFLEKELFEVKGPFLEYVAKPQLDEDEYHEFCQKLHIEKEVRNAFEKVLFSKSQDNRLYKHQAEFIKAVLTEEEKDFVLAVPTASGKTESFLIPILNECLKNNNEELKAIIFYPTKTLAVDQLNRIIKYIYEINIQLEGTKDHLITVGIWDGDTKYEVGNSSEEYNKIPNNSLIRGIRCPVCGEKLKITYGEIIICPKCDFETTWIKATRKAIMQKVNILITNPEAFDFLFIDPAPSKRAIIANYAYASNVRYVVFDEAHYWTGASGSAIHMLCQRLRFLFGNKLKIMILSATIGNPSKFGFKLTGRENTTILFQPETINYNYNNEDIGRIPIASTAEFLDALHELIKNPQNQDRILESIDENTLRLLEFLGYISNKKLSINQELTIKLNSDTVEELVKNRYFVSDIRERIIKKLPEILELRKFLSNKGNKPISFTHLNDVYNFVKTLDKNSYFSKDQIKLLTMQFLTLGRIAQLLQDRFHYFIRGNDGIYYCDTCNIISTKQKCESCGKILTKKLFFCSQCHNIFYREIDKEIDSEIEEDILKRELSFVELSKGVEILRECPRCGNNVTRTYGVRDGSVFYPQLLSQFLSAYGRYSKSKKILVFADSRDIAERVGSDFTQNDYHITCQRFTNSLLSKPRTAFEIYSETRKFIDRTYYFPIINALQDNASKSIWKTYRDESLKEYAYLNTATMLINACILTPTCVLTESRNDIQAFLGHFIFRILIQRSSFTRYNINFDGLTLERIRSMLSKISLVDTNSNLPNVLKYLYEYNVIGFAKREIIEGKIKERYKDDEKRINEIINYFEDQTRQLNELLETVSTSVPTGCFGIINMKYRIKQSNDKSSKDFSISRVDNVHLCKTCKKVFPLIDGSLTKCLYCNGELLSGDRSKSGGYLKEKTSAGVPFDYWARELNIKDETEKVIPLIIAVHRAGFPQELRTVIEDHFKQKDAKVNIISATTTFELGIDIGDLDTIFLVGLPPGIANYIQRSGRAGRSIGHSSIVVTFVRNGNEIDDYYFEDLEDRYFNSMPDIGVPENENVEVIFAGQIVTLSAGYLARNYDERDIYNKIWDVSIERLKQNFIKHNINRVKLFVRLLSDEKHEELVEIVKECFGDSGIKIFNKIIMNKGDFSIVERVRDYFNHYRNVELTHESKIKLSERFRQFSQLLHIVGYLANYRGFTQSIPIFNKNNKELENKSVLDAIRENFPGYKNNNKPKGGKSISGGHHSISMVEYVTYSVTASRPILTTKVCGNQKCDNYQIKADKRLKTCIYCGNKLTEIKVYMPDTIKIQPLRKDLGYRAHPFIVKDVEFTEFNKNNIEITESFHISAFHSKCHLITFVPAYMYRFRNSKDWTILPSQAEIPKDIDYETLDEDNYERETIEDLLKSFENEEQPTSKKYVPIGYSVYTRACAFDIPIKEIITTFKDSNKLNQEEKRTLAIFESTMEQALIKAVSLVVGCNHNDFSILSTHTETNLRFIVADNCEGGNGVSDTVFDNLNKVFEVCFEIVSCKYCNKYCRRCVLTEETSQRLIELNILDRKVVQEVLKRYFT